MTEIPLTPDPLGMTLAEYAAFRGKHPQSIREDYRTLMRNTDPQILPQITRRTDDTDGTTKFCLPLENTTPTSTPLETESVIIPMTSFGGTSWYTLCLSSQK